MKVTRKDLDWAAEQGLLRPEQVDPLWDGLSKRDAGPELSFETAAYALGAILVVAALSWFTSRVWQLWGDGALTAALSGYFLALVAVGREVRFGRDLRTPGDILFLLASGLVPLIVVGILRMTGLWDSSVVPPDGFVMGVELQSLVTALVTAGVAAGIARAAPSPLLLLPVVAALGVAFLDATAIAFHGIADDLFLARRIGSAVFGLGTIAIALRLDRGRTTDGDDWALWPYVVGLVFFWGALTAGNTESEFVRFLYFAANLVLIFASVVLRRSIFLAFGAVGSLIYLISLASRLFEDSILFPAVLALIGVLVILGGVSYRKNRERIEAWAGRVVPAGLRDRLPPVR